MTGIDVHQGLQMIDGLSVILPLGIQKFQKESGLLIFGVDLNRLLVSLDGLFALVEGKVETPEE